MYNVYMYIYISVYIYMEIKWRVILVFCCLVFYSVILACSVWLYFVFFIVFVTDVFGRPPGENSP